MMKLRFNEKRAVELFGILQDGWKNQKGVFNAIVLPQDRWPLPTDPVQAANYLAYTAITQRGGVVSEDPFKWVNQMRLTHPDLFDPVSAMTRFTVRDIMDIILRTVLDRKSWGPQPEQVSFLEQSDVVPEEIPVQKGGNTGTYKLDEFAASWHNNSVTLAQRWDGNALNIYEGVGDFEEAFARVDYKNVVNKDKRAFIGIRRKIFSLLTVWLQEKNLIPVFPTPIPVDFHALRLLFATGVVTADELSPFLTNADIHPAHLNGRTVVRVTEKITDEIAVWSQPFMVKHGFSHLAINPALWVLSRELCPGEFQNKATGRGRVGSRRSIELVYPEDLIANPALWPMPYDDPAQVCPLSPMCRKAIPSGPYYSFGMLVVSDRVPYPHPRLFSGAVDGANLSAKNSRK